MYKVHYYVSLQDTVISIQALAEYASSRKDEPGPEYGVSFNISNFRGFNHVYLTDPSTFDFVHSFEVLLNSLSVTTRKYFKTFRSKPN